MTLVCVTGAAGRVGSTLVRRLSTGGYDVRAVVRPGNKKFPMPSEVETAEADLTDGRALRTAVEGAAVVIHLAAQMPLGDSTVEEYYDINVLGTLRVLEASVGAGRTVRRFIYASTDNTYGPADPNVMSLTEESEQFPGDYYGTSKVLCEHLVRNYRKIHGLQYTILRYGSVLAPNEAGSLFRMSWVRGFLETHSALGPRSNLWPLFKLAHGLATLLPAPDQADDPAVCLVGPDGAPWSIHLTDVRDTVEGTIRCIESPAAANECFNIVGPRATSFAEGAKVIAKHRDTTLLNAHMPVRLAFELSNAKAERLLGYRPRYDFESTLLAGSGDTRATDYVPVGAGWTAPTS
ncbi:UDP-glucose 4-epimerase [Amycolatopsis thermoflava]|uniref:UDP-glucose 4-epimerase n=1 Tax=Amycolatopsis thermoflava TaxID=84480 RepID=A0A3N2GVM5_9PSEU|nr:UDP-glucose 4-epimerase [Amycolatopsis thermoflava]